MPGDDVAVIRVSGLTKRYGDLSAVDDVGLEVNAGEVYALVGLNGAGKTTLIRMLLGMVRPSSGSVSVAGRPVTDRSVWADVGYLVETPSSYPDLTVRENLEIARRLRMMPGHRAVDDALDRFDWDRMRGRRRGPCRWATRSGSGWPRLLHHPQILVLDEPVNGLDPAGVVEIRELLVGLARDDGVTILLSSHLLSEVTRVATRIGVLHHGRLIEARSRPAAHREAQPGWKSAPGTWTVPPRSCAVPSSRYARSPMRCWSTAARPCTTPRTSRPRWSPAASRRLGSRSWRKTSRATSCGSSGTPTPSPLSGDDRRTRAAVGAEVVKVRRSVVLGATGLLGGRPGRGVLHVRAAGPGRARSMGLLGTRPRLRGGAADWPAYLTLVSQIVAVGGMLFGMILIWLFGREFSDRTAKDLLALPTSRAAVVLAKLVVALG